MLSEAKRPRVVGERDGSNPIQMTGSMLNVGLSGFPTSINNLGITVGGDVPYFSGRGLPRRLNVKFAVPAVTPNSLDISVDLNQGDVFFIRKRLSANDKFWIRDVEEMIDTGDFRNMRSVWGMSIRTLNQIIHMKSMSDKYDEITPYSMAKEFVCAGVVHTDATENSDGSFRVLGADWTNDNVQMRNIYTKKLQSDDVVGVLYTRRKLDAVTAYSVPGTYKSDTYFNVTKQNKKIPDVVCVIPYVLRAGNQWPRKNTTCARDVGDSCSILQPTYFSLLGSVIRRSPFDMLRGAQMYLDDYYESEKMEFTNAAFDAEFAMSSLIGNIEVRLTGI